MHLLIYSLLETILIDESIGKTDPLNSHLKDIVKSFMIFIENNFRDANNFYPELITAEISINKQKLSYPPLKDNSNNKVKKSIAVFIINILNHLFKNKTPKERNVIVENIRKDKLLENFAFAPTEFKTKFSGKNEKQQKDKLKRHYQVTFINDRSPKISDLDYPFTLNSTNESVYVISNQWAATGKSNNLKPFLQTIKNLYPTVEIIIQEKIKYGKSDKDTYPQTIKLERHVNAL